MSRAPLVGVVKVRYWVYMAIVMAECLNQIIEGKKEIKIPVNILHDARLFFKIVLGQRTGDTMFDNQPAQTNARIIAWDILNDCSFLKSGALEEKDGYIYRFAEFLESLEKQPTVPFGSGWCKQLVVPLDEKNKKTVADLHDFFKALLRKDARESRH